MLRLKNIFLPFLYLLIISPVQSGYVGGMECVQSKAEITHSGQRVCQNRDTRKKILQDIAKIIGEVTKLSLEKMKNRREFKKAFKHFHVHGKKIQKIQNGASVFITERIRNPKQSFHGRVNHLDHYVRNSLSHLPNHTNGFRMASSRLIYLNAQYIEITEKIILKQQRLMRLYQKLGSIGPAAVLNPSPLPNTPPPEVPRGSDSSTRSPASEVNPAQLRTQANKLMEEGRKLQQEKKYREASKKFTEASKLYRQAAELTKKKVVTNPSESQLKQDCEKGNLKACADIAAIFRKQGNFTLFNKYSKYNNKDECDRNGPGKHGHCYTYAAISKKEGNFAEAKKYYKKSCMKPNPNPAACYGLAEVFEKEGNFSEAKKYRDMENNINRKLCEKADPTACNHILHVYRRLGDWNSFNKLRERVAQEYCRHFKRRPITIKDLGYKRFTYCNW